MVFSSLPVNQAGHSDSWSAHRMNKTIKLKEKLNYEKNNFVPNIQKLQKKETETWFYVNLLKR